MGRLAARPGVGSGAAAGLIGVVLGYALHVGVVILALVTRQVVSPPDTTIKEQGSPVFFGFVLGYPASTAVFVPAAIVTGASLGLAARWYTPAPSRPAPPKRRPRPGDDESSRH